MKAQALAAVLQLADSTLPVGRYAHSHGLEAWLAGHPDAADGDLAEAVWTGVAAIASLDAVFLREAMRAPTCTEITALDRRLRSAKCVSGARVASESCGRQLAALATGLGPHGPATDAFLAEVARDASPGNLAVVEGRLLTAAGADAEDAVPAVLYAAAAAGFTVPVRLGRMGARAAQRELWTGRAHLAALAAESLDTVLDDAHAGAVELEIRMMQHERSARRLFRT